MFLLKIVRFYHFLGVKLNKARYLLMLIILIGFCASLWLVFSSAQLSEKYLYASLLVNTWLLLTLSLAYFRADDFLVDRNKMGLLKKIFSTIRLAFGAVLVISFTVLGLILLWFSFSTLSRFLFS